MLPLSNSKVNESNVRVLVYVAVSLHRDYGDCGVIALYMLLPSVTLVPSLLLPAMSVCAEY